MFLINDEHRERADNVETCNCQDEREKYVGHQLLNFHNLKGISLLLISVQYQEVIAKCLLYGFLYASNI